MRLSANQGLAAAFLNDLRILIQDVAMPRRPLAWGSRASIREITLIVSPKTMGSKNLHSRIASKAIVSTLGAWLIKPVAMARPKMPWATGRPKGPLFDKSWLE